MKKRELIKRVSDISGIDKYTCTIVIDAMFTEMLEALVDEGRVSIPGFMTYVVVERPPRRARNPKTGDVEMFPSVKILKTKVSQEVKSAINSA